MLEPALAIIEAFEGRRRKDLRAVFAEVARRRPDLAAASREACRARGASGLERVWREVQLEIRAIEAAEAWPSGLEAPFLSHLRINGATGRPHVGHGFRSAALFAER